MNFLNVFEQSTEFEKYKKALDNTPVSVAGVVESALAHFIYSSADKKRKLVVMYSEDEAKSLYSDMKFFDENVLYFPQREFVYYNIDALAHFNEHKRIDCLAALFGEDSEITVITTLEAALSPTIPPELLKSNSILIKQGERYDIQELSKKLVELGYTRDDVCEGCGQFSLRGGILDIYSPANDFPYRIEFFDDEVDSVRIFDYVSQRTLEMAESALILPCKEIIYKEEERLEICNKIDEKLSKLKKKKGDYTELFKNIEADKEAIITDRELASLDKYYSFIYDKIYTILDYFTDDDMIFVYEPKRLAEKAKSLLWEEEEKLFELFKNGMIISDGVDFSLPFDAFCEKSEKMCHISVNSLNHSSISYKYKAIFDFKSRQTVSLHGKIDYLFSDLEQWQKDNTTVIILAQNRGRGENIAGILTEHAIEAKFVSNKNSFEKGKVSVICGELKKGFEFPELGFVIISER